MRVSRQGICLGAVALFSFATVCHAQSAETPETEYKKLLRVNEDIQPLGDKPFGEHISLYNGSLSFEQTDISLPGSGPLMQLSRSLKVSTFEEAPPSYVSALSDWDLDIPHLETVTANRLNVTGWIVAGGTDGTTRCTNFAPPPAVSFQKNYTDWLPRDWWTSGYQLIMPGEGSEEVIRVATGAPVPQVSGVTFPLLTKNHWAFSCLGSTDNGEPGEGFKGVAPDGTSYWFNHLIYRDLPAISRPSSQDAGDLLPRRMALMLVTRVQDRFGNYLTYTYSGANLTTITAGDGRQISLQYVPGMTLVASATAQATDTPARKWTYQYTANTLPTTLSNVILPDGSAWTFDLVSFAKADLALAGAGSCDFVENLDPGIVSGTITHPSGLVGTFQLQRVVRGRSYVPKQCWGTPAQAAPIYATFPDLSYQFAVISKTQSGAGLPTQTWRYSYSPPNASWSSDSCASSNACPSTVWTDAVDPDGPDTRYTFSNRFDVSEGVLQRTDYFAGAYGTAVVRSELNAYANPTGGPWPSQVGYNLETNVNNAELTEIYPLNQRTIVQDGDTYTWQALAFNAYAQPTDVKRYSSIAGQSAIEASTTYLNDPALWVLGLPQQTTNVTTGEVESLNAYNPSNDTLQSRARFGQTLMSYTFDANGNLASFTDGNAHTTRLTNYKRGIPQTITYPNTWFETLVVDDLGEISSLTDQAGATTGYSYDPIGRLRQITYPTGDEQTWLSKTFTYDYVTAAERGLAAGHWRRTVATGNAQSVTYFDAMLRPVLSDNYINGNSGSDTTALSNYDGKGQKIFGSYAQGSAVNFTTDPGLAKIFGSYSSYDALGRLSQRQQDSELGTLTTTTAYLSGARMQVTDPKANVTTTSYQVFDEPAYDAVIQVQAPTGITQMIARDLYGNPLSITQSGQYNGTGVSLTKTLTYDSYHRLCRTTEPESGSEVMDYDGANNIAWSAAGLTITGTGCGQEQVATAGRTVRTYGPLNAVLTITPPTGTQSTHFGYDKLSQLKNAYSGPTTWTATRNKRGMITAETLQTSGQSVWTLRYAHDAYGSLRQLTYPDGEVVLYAPDALGRVTQVGGYLTGVGYFPEGDVASYTYGNGQTYLADKNKRRLVDNFTVGQGSTLGLSEDLVYDSDGNITDVKDVARGPRTKAFGYDALDRLTSAQANALWGTESYTYDPLNNIRTRVGNGQTSTYNYDPANRLASITGASASSFQYDNRGNVINKNGAVLNFDQQNQLMQINGYDSYSYDAFGRRTQKTPAGGAPVYYFYTQAGQLLYQWDTGSAKTTNFVYLGSKLVARNENLKLVAPAAISFDANPNNGSYTVNWSASAGASSYNLQESANGGAWVTVISGNTTSATMSGKGGGSYLYQVQACAGATCTGWTASIALNVRPALSTVTVPSGTINGTYTVSWTASASATGYDVQESFNSGAWTTIATGTAATSISRPGTTSGSYTYQVSASNAYSTRGWAGSTAVTVDTNYGVVPTAPASLNVPASSNTGSATLSWSAAALATRYAVEQSNNGGTSWTGIYNSSGTSTSVSGLADGSYSYHVQACDTYGCSAWTAGNATLVVTHPPTAAPTLSVPANSVNGSYTVSWSGVPGQVSYTLQEQVNGGSWSTVQTAGNTSWSTSGRGNGSYGYQVQACNVGGCGPWSAVVSTTVLLPPAAPGSISVPATSNGPIAISWAGSATATSYGVDQSINSGAWAQVYAGSSTSTSVTATSSGNYSYRAFACNASGCNGYATSGAVVVTIPPASAPAISVPTSSTSGSYSIGWSGVAGATSYTLQEQVNGGGWSTVQATGAVSWSTSGRGNGTYGYHVQGCNAGGCGPWSGVGSITVALVPLIPGGLHTVVVNATKGSYTVAWNAVGGATSYDMQQTLPNGTVNMPYSGANTTASALDLATQGQVLVQVRACNANGCSGWSASIAIMLSSN